MVSAPTEESEEEDRPAPSRPAWFTPKNLIFNDFTAVLFRKLADYRESRFPRVSSKGSLLNDDGSINFEASRKWWIEKYAKQYRSNKIGPDIVTLPPHSPSILSRIRQPVIYTLPVFGPGVGAAQKAIYELVAQAPHSVSMYTGVRGIGTGIGINLYGSVVKLSPIHNPPQPFLRIAVEDENWKNLFATASVFVYAISRKVPLDESKEELRSFLSLNFDETGAPLKTPKPLLILSFIQDSPASVIAEALDLHNLPSNQIWGLKCCHQDHKIRDLHFALQWAKEQFRL
jgi:hypothetical protein